MGVAPAEARLTYVSLVMPSSTGSSSRAEAEGARKVAATAVREAAALAVLHLGPGVAKGGVRHLVERAEPAAAAR